MTHIICIIVEGQESYLQLIHINLDKIHIRIFARELFEGWLYELARSTPCSREINHHLYHQKRSNQHQILHTI